MSDDQNLVSPEPPTTCTQWMHPSGEGCELKTHLSSDPVTAPDVVELIAVALYRSVVSFPGELHPPLSELPKRQQDKYHRHARAILSALTEAGKVEWGVAWKGAGPGGVLAFDSEEDACEAVELGGLLSRLTLPWKAVQ